MSEICSCRNALNTEKELLKRLGEKDPTFVEVTHSLAESVMKNLLSYEFHLTFSRPRFRATCQNAIPLDFEAARAVDAEGRLWDAHLKVNTRFRKLLGRVSTPWSCLFYIPESNNRP